MDEEAIRKAGRGAASPDLARSRHRDTADLGDAWPGLTATLGGPALVLASASIRRRHALTTSLGQGPGPADRDYYLIDQAGLRGAPRRLRGHIAAMFTWGIADGVGKAARIYALEDKLPVALTGLTRATPTAYNIWLTADFAPRRRASTGPVLYGFVLPTGPISCAHDGASPLCSPCALAPWLIGAIIYPSPDQLQRRVLSKASRREFRLQWQNLTAPRTARPLERGVRRQWGPGRCGRRLTPPRHFRRTPRQSPGADRNIKAALAIRIRTCLDDRANQAKSLAKLAALRVEVGYEEKPRGLFAVPFIRRRLRTACDRSATRPSADGGLPSRSTAASGDDRLASMLHQFRAGQGDFPAAILQPRSSIRTPHSGQLRRDRVVIGHEISHQFDDQGFEVRRTGKLETGVRR